MFKEVETLIQDPIAMDAFYLEMRLSNDPEMAKHAEDYNLMVLEMVKTSQQRVPPPQSLLALPHIAANQYSITSIA